MALLRYLALAALVPTLMAGCSQSLFGDLSGGNDGRRDGSVPEPDPDARPVPPDGGPGPGPDGGADELDGGPDVPDASVRAACPDPCAGDAFGDFSSQQGGGNGRWRYIEVRPEAALQEQYVDMTVNFFPGAVLGWRGVGTPPPSLALCVGVEPAPPCLELRGSVALTTSSGTAAHRPALLWTAPQEGTYLVTGSWRGSSQGEGVAAALTFALDDEEHVLGVEEGSLTATRRTFELMVTDLVVGDELVVSARTDSGEVVSIGVDLFISGPK